MAMLRPAAAAILTLLAYVLLRQLRPEFAPAALLAGISLILISAASHFTGLQAELSAWMERAGVSQASVSILVRTFGVCVVTQLAADLCRDHAASSLATAIELAGRLAALILALPLLRALTEIAAGLLQAS